MKSSVRPLLGVRVLDLSTSYAGPTASMYLSDFGAEVIKIERDPDGDDARTWGPPFVDGSSVWFASANRGKSSVRLDIRGEEGRAVLDGLLAEADVLLVSFNPSKLARLGLDPEEIRFRFPGLIYCVISGYGLDGPDSGSAGYDLAAQARSGMMSVTGASPDSPQRVSTALSDVAAAMVAVATINAALVHRARTGEGALLDISLLDVDLALMAPRIASFLAGDPEPQPCGATDSVLAVYQVFNASDRAFTVAVGNDSMWVRLCAEIGADDLAANEELRTNDGRRAHRQAIVQRLAEVFDGEPAAAWVERLNRIGVPSSLVQSLSEVVRDPQVQARGTIIELPLHTGKDARTFRAVASPWRIDGQVPQPQSPPPRLGESTPSVLASMDLGSEAHNGLRREVSWADR